MWAAGICLSETPIAVGPGCGTCRMAALSSLYGKAPWAIGVSVGAALVARFASRLEFQVARSGAVVALALWLASVGIIRGWW